MKLSPESVTRVTLTVDLDLRTGKYADNKEAATLISDAVREAVNRNEWSLWGWTVGWKTVDRGAR